MRLSRRTQARRRRARWTERGVLITCGAAAGALATKANRRNTHRVIGTAKGALHGAATTVGGGRDIDDVTLARKVESEIFRPAGAPKGNVSVNAQAGVVELRGEVSPAWIAKLGDAASKVGGVRDVHNLLHAPGTPAPHAPPSEPEEVRARAAQRGEE